MRVREKEIGREMVREEEWEREEEREREREIVIESGQTTIPVIHIEDA